MTYEQLLDAVSAQCDLLRTHLNNTTEQLNAFTKRLIQISQQLRKNIPLRDETFAADFNGFCQELRTYINEKEPIWASLRASLRARRNKDQTSADLALPAKGFNNRAKMLSRVCDEFTTSYTLFCKEYKRFTAAKLNVWLLTSCQTDLENLTGKILFLARELARKTEQNRRPHED